MKTIYFSRRRNHSVSQPRQAVSRPQFRRPVRLSMLPIRFLIYGLATICITLLYALRLAFHSTIICQIVEDDEDGFLRDDTLRQLTFQSVAFGLAIGLIPLHFMNSWGTRNVTTIFGFLGVGAAMMYPLAHRHDFYASFVVRVAQGAPLAILLWLIAKIASEWTPRGEMALALAILTSVYQMAPFVAQITAAEMCEHFGWEYTYYSLAVLCAACHVAFYCVYTDNAQENRYAGDVEKRLIGEHKKREVVVVAATPFRAILTDATVLATWLANIAFFSTLLIFLQYGPLYIHQLLGFSVRTTGYSGGFSHVLCLVAKISFGRLMDRCEIEMTKRLKLAWALIEVPSIGLLLAVMMVDNSLMKLSAIVLFIAIHGVAIVIIVKTQTFRSAQYSHVLANGNTLCVVVCLFVQPIIVKCLVQSNTIAEWSHVFGLHAGLVAVSIIVFLVFVDSRPARWTTDLVVDDEKI
ncbi:unnamed protein product [Caenorhabditis bovis]|uniref:Major facilitator superfamily (MFS) profile domain-containing protein n=1 Tax=Caenorhabditis bovis TaxID=2654633 RepID=A0A8S1EYV9_9PELO|nr:unnamed protein product [Caenorhabditis bovis]